MNTQWLLLCSNAQKNMPLAPYPPPPPAPTLLPPAHSLQTESMLLLRPGKVSKIPAALDIAI